MTPSDPNPPKAGGLLARLFGLGQTEEREEKTEPAKDEFMPDWDAPGAAEPVQSALKHFRDDFERFGFVLDLGAADPANTLRVTHLGEMNRWRNLAAHRVPAKVRSHPISAFRCSRREGKVRVQPATLPTVRRKGDWRSEARWPKVPPGDIGLAAVVNHALGFATRSQAS